MELDTFALLGGFALVKVCLGFAIVWAGLRSGERPEDAGGGGEPPVAPDRPRPPARRVRPRRNEREPRRARGPRARPPARRRAPERAR